VRTEEEEKLFFFCSVFLFTEIKDSRDTGIGVAS